MNKLSTEFANEQIYNANTRLYFIIEHYSANQITQLALFTQKTDLREKEKNTERSQTVSNFVCNT